MSDALLTSWGAAIKAGRIKSGYNLTQFAAHLGVVESTVNRWENGKHEPPRHQKAAIAAALGMTVAELFPLEAA